MRPSRSKLLTAVTVSRRSAAGICTAVQDALRKAKDGERAVTSLRAHCTCSCERLSGRRASQRHDSSAAASATAAAEAASPAGDRVGQADDDERTVRTMRLARRGVGNDCDRAVLIKFFVVFPFLSPKIPKFSSPAAR